MSEGASTDALNPLPSKCSTQSSFFILAADYSQLELRILAHLSGDERLTKILNDGKDVFKAIAAKWKRVEVDQVGEPFTLYSRQS